MHKLDQKEVVKLGIITFVMIIAIGFLLIWKSGIFLRAQGYKLVGEFQGIGGLLDGAEVRYRGYSVGKVSKIMPDPEKIRVDFWVYSHIKIPVGSKLRVIFDGLIGERYISIAPSDSKEIVKPGGIIHGYATSGLADFVDVGTQSLEQSRQILDSINSVISSKEVITSLKQSFIEFGKLVNGLNELTNEIRTVTKSGEIKKILVSLERLSESMETAASIVGDKEVLQKVKNTVSNIEIISEELKNMVSDKDTKSGVKTAVKKSSNFISTLFSLEFSYEGLLKYIIEDKDLAYDFHSDITSGSKFLRIGFSGANEWPDVYHVQIGTWLTNNLSARVGFIHNSPGLGLDYYLMDNIKLYTNIYDLKDVKLNFYGRYNLLYGLGINAGVDNALSETNRKYIFGVSYSP